jgi:threonine dehydrogenase-like Zn-dependent dehydrogenase
MVITWRETLSYLTRMGVPEGARVVVFGSGGNGLAFAAHAANLGAMQVAVVGAGGREEASRKVGATHFLDYKARDVSERLLELCSEGFDFAIDAVGKQGVGDLALSVLSPGGTLGIYGMDDFGKCTILPRNAKGSFTFYNGGYDEAETHDRVMELIASGRLDASVWLDLENPYPLEEINEAFEALRRREGIKALVKIGARGYTGLH